MTSYNHPGRQRARTKIVATVGPACASGQQLSQLVAAGVDVFRLNMAHGSLEQHQAVLGRIRDAAEQHDRPIGVLADLGGPKIRLGTLVEDPLDCLVDAEISFIRGDSSTRPDQLTTNYGSLIDELSAGDRIMLADGTVEMRVVDKTTDRVRCQVITPGILRSRQGVNLPGVRLSVPTITPRDRDHVVWAARHAVDFVGLSFVRAAADVRELKEMLYELGSHAQAIAKIEKPEALQCLEEIVSAADGVMVARGDLGVEIDVAETPIAQKRIIDTCTRFRRPVIVATQMLDSMQHARRPTRAEVSDVANAILDGADACMLSGETAIGKYPREAVEMMNRIMVSTERILAERPSPAIGHAESGSSGIHRITESVVYGAACIAQRLHAKVVVIATKTGRTALVKSKQRDFISTISVSNREETLRQMSLLWGVAPIRGALADGPALRDFIDAWGREHAAFSKGDLVVLLSSGDFRTDAHNQVLVHEVP